MKRFRIWLARIVRTAASLSGAAPFGIKTIKGSGNIVIEERDVSGFDRVALSGVGQVIIIQGDEESLTIETDDNLMGYIESNVREGTLELSFSRNITPVPTQSIIYRVGVVDLTGLASSGAGSFEIDRLETDRLRITLSGAGDIEIDSLRVTNLDVRASGAGNIKVAGAIDTQELDLSGGGGYTAPDLESRTASVRISGAGNVVVWVLDVLDVMISGVGNVEYYGSPSVTQAISGVGTITSRGDK